MKSEFSRCQDPQGGVQLPDKPVRRWRWSNAGEPLSAPIRCKKEQWYLARGYLIQGRTDSAAAVLINFLREGEVIARRCVPLQKIPGGAAGENLLGWVKTPEDSTHFQIQLPREREATCFTRLVLHPVSERDPICHPLAAVPRWNTYRPPFPLERVVLPSSLRPLEKLLPELEMEFIEHPRSFRRLASRAIGAACVVAPEWIDGLRPDLRDVEQLAAASWLVLDLESFARLLKDGGRLAPKIATYTSEHEIMSARIDYADVQTRGFALEDVVPYSILAGENGFSTRILRADRAWKRYAADAGYAMLLTSETPWVNRCGDVLSTARSIDCGMLLATDLPWLVAGKWGRLIAPRVAEHLLRMHLGAPLADGVQYWTRWNDIPVVVRDIGELSRRYPPLRTLRWAPHADGAERLGLMLPASRSKERGRRLMLCTGRIDQAGPHDGLPPEPFEIFMKWLARERRERTAWAEKYLTDTAVIWQFDTLEGRKYASIYKSAAEIAGLNPKNTLYLYSDAETSHNSEMPATSKSTAVWRLPALAGFFGDRSHTDQADLMQRLKGWIERMRR